MGSKPERTVTVAKRYRRANARLNHRKVRTSQSGLTGWPKMGLARDQVDVRQPGFTPDGPVDSAALKRAQNGQQERSNHPVLSMGVDTWSRCQPQVRVLEGWSKKQMPTGKPWDMQTWTTTEGM